MFYAVGIWTVKPGHEEEFVAAWAEMGRRTLEQFPHSRAELLRDHEHANRFVSLGPWHSHDELEAWRASAAFQEGVGLMRSSLEDFHNGVFELAREVG